VHGTGITDYLFDCTLQTIENKKKKATSQLRNRAIVILK
jgi:hypothetical protein